MTLKKDIALCFIFAAVLFTAFQIRVLARDAPDELTLFIARTIAESNNREGALIAYVKSVSFPVRAVDPITVWKTDKGGLSNGDAETLKKAVTSADRKDWPPYVYLFSFRARDPGRAVVNVCTMYDMGITKKSRGGNMRSWTLINEGGKWRVTNKAYRMMWD